MIEIDKRSEDSTRVILLHKGAFNDTIGKELEEMVQGYIRENHRIEINLNELPIIEKGGYPYLSSIVKQTFDSNCDLTFSNVHEDISEIIDSFTFSSEG